MSNLRETLGFQSEFRCKLDEPKQAGSRAKPQCWHHDSAHTPPNRCSYFVARHLFSITVTLQKGFTLRKNSLQQIEKTNS